MSNICRFLLIAVSIFAGASQASAENYAFIVGVGGYDEKQLKPLGKFPRKDAIEFRNVLLESGFKDENVVLMVDDINALPKTGRVGRYLPEADKIRSELMLLIPTLERDDSLVIAMAGHGVQFKGEDEPFFCPSDARLDDRKSLLSLKWLYEQLTYDEATGKGCKPRQKLLLIDACRNDPASSIARSAGQSEGLASVTLPQVAPLPEGVVALFSCSEGQQALQHDPLGHGVFFYHVLEGWRGQADGDNDEQVTLDEVIAFTKSKTKSYARLQLASRQEPRQKGYFDGTWVLRSRSRPSEFTNSIGMKLKLIPAGSFVMGSTAGQIGEVRDWDKKYLGPDFQIEWLNDESPPHRVTLSRPFYLGVYELTKGQFAEFVKATSYVTESEKREDGTNGSSAKPAGSRSKQTWRSTSFEYEDNHPVVNVTWNDAIAFCEWLTQKEGRKYRLPTEAEWEYSCRAGSTQYFQTGDDPEGLATAGNVADATAKAQISRLAAIDASDGQVFPARVGLYRPNSFGLYDMHGNVWEWCADWFGADYYGKSPLQDPNGPADGTMRCCRSGAWDYSAAYTRSGHRGCFDPSRSAGNFGFRVVCE